MPRHGRPRRIASRASSVQIPPAQLDRHLQGELRSVYWVVGDEQLLVDEACDAIFAAAKRHGFNERTLFEALPRASWRELFENAANLSLFGGKRLLDVRVPERGLDRAGSDAMRGYLTAPLPDTMLVCRAVGLEWRVQSSAWYKALENAGAAVRIRPVSARDLPRWLEARCRTEGLRVHADALTTLAERVEGNLLAARQEIEKLKLLGRSGELGVEDVLAAVGDSSHFDTFALLAAAYAGQPARVRKMVAGLRGQGVAVFAILGALVGQLQRLRELAGGGEQRVPRNLRQGLAALRRVGLVKFDELMRDCALLDMQAKGMLRGDPWQTLEDILLVLAGRDRPGLEKQAPWLWNY